MDEPQEHRRVGRAKRGSSSNYVPEAAASGDVAIGPSAPCGACKFLRRKCVSGCIFAPHFGSDQGAARFAAVHKVFGASNVSKLLMHIPDNKRHEAVATIWYEAQARLSDPVYGCVSKIATLQQQVQSLQTELSVVQNQLMSSRYAMANAFQNKNQQQYIPMMQPSYSNASSASNNFMNINNFSPNFEETTARSNSFEPNISHVVRDEEDNETHDPAAAFANYIFH